MQIKYKFLIFIEVLLLQSAFLTRGESEKGKGVPLPKERALIA